ncbi:MAG: hypothetical protein AAFR36_29245 [Bacteroidota bacterium]
MNPYKHAEISVSKRGGKVEDYYPIHNFFDATKELCSDNRHRILHNLWGIRRVVIPIFGPVLVNSDGKQVNVKDLCEQDHVLPDYRNRFIPTLSDFVLAFDELEEEEISQINRIYDSYSDNKEVQELLLSPLNVSGHVKSLRITHNTWFCNEIIPKVFSLKPKLEGGAGIQLFTKMNFHLWMDNGAALPASAQKMEALL